MNKYNDLLTKNPYFNVSGLTSSEANYICELIKEKLKPIQDSLSHLPTHERRLDGEILDNHQKVTNIDKKLGDIGEWYAISAYLRSAIKEKERRLDAISFEIRELRYKLDSTLDDSDGAALSRLLSVEMDDFLLTLPLDEVLDYKTAEAKAAHIGKFIHNFDELRQKLNKQERISLEKIGEQVFKIYHIPLYEMNELESLQAYLLREHREFETTVNQYKARFHEFQNQARIRYENELAAAQNARQEKLNALVAAETEKLTAIKQEIADFKIIVPNRFRAMIDDLTSPITLDK